MSLQEIEPTIQDEPKKEIDWFTIRNATMVGGTGLVVGVLSTFTLGIAGAIAAAWMLGIAGSAKESFDDIASAYQKVKTEDERRSIYVKAMRPHDRNMNCPCWDCQVEKNPKFIHDPANGKYKYWDEIPDPLVAALRKIFINNKG